MFSKKLKTYLPVMEIWSLGLYINEIDIILLNEHASPIVV